MLLADAEKLANRLLIEFGLHDEGWIFDWNNASRSFGCCHVTRKLITLSRKLVLLNDLGQVEDTIRHEIAHALCPPKTGHGPAWKAMCMKVGARPVRCATGSEVVIEGNWQAKCRMCGRNYHKTCKPKRELFCSNKECKQTLPYGRFHPERKLEWYHKSEPKPTREAIESMKALLREAETR